MSSFKNFGYFFGETFKSLRRNRLLSIATVTTVSICILILGVAVLMTINAGHFINRLESDIEMMVFVDNSLNRSQISDLEREIKDLDGVKSVTFISKEQALKRLQDKFAGQEYNLKNTVGKNPLPDSFEVKAENPQNVTAIAAKIQKMNGVEKVNYGQGIIERLLKVTQWVRIISVTLIVFLALGAVFLIATTIRLAIFSRRKEIYLMKLIGATDWFIRWPFFIEGIILGSLGSLIAILFLALGYSSLLNNIQTAMFFIPMVTNPGLLTKIYVALFASGALLGVLGTYISLNRFLDV
ncbi:ABC transporter, cell division protein FtsX [Syntrophomonas zehnderi OL-4]|uniref:Cell division protein FtsX n=1 Tax=Syntrophomonas zehnderi OL-4 TaxID=690567 RepID=A0A0E4GTX3_9FIRM|nr:permease-like cell division protein FtsX [Syntrophomonas zehnderi]CQB51992.1 ABC transporter, cell division protein FtsX [Syntrophomonas zehnderi OL-4]